MSNIYTLIQNLDRVDDEVLFRNQSRLVEIALADQDHMLFGRLASRLGITPEDEVQANLLERYQAEISQAHNYSTAPLVIPRRTEVPSHTRERGYVYGWLREFYRKNGIRPPTGLSKMRKDEILRHYADVLRTYNISEKIITPPRND